MKYQVTCLRNSDYCRLKPNDKDCQYVIEVKANSKEEARMKVHESYEREYNLAEANVVPMVWEVK